MQWHRLYDLFVPEFETRFQQFPWHYNPENGTNTVSSGSEDSNIDAENGYIMGDLDSEVGGHSRRKQLIDYQQWQSPRITLFVVSL